MRLRFDTPKVRVEMLNEEDPVLTQLIRKYGSRHCTSITINLLCVGIIHYTTKPEIIPIIIKKESESKCR